MPWVRFPMNPASRASSVKFACLRGNHHETNHARGSCGVDIGRRFIRPMIGKLSRRVLRQPKRRRHRWHASTPLTFRHGPLMTPASCIARGSPLLWRRYERFSCRKAHQPFDPATYSSAKTPSPACEQATSKKDTFTPLPYNHPHQHQMIPKNKARVIEALRWLLLLPGSWLAAVVILYISAFIINRYTYDTAILLDYFVATIAASY